MSGSVVLVGLSGTGKTTVGRLVAARLGLPFVDTDEVIAARVGAPVHRIFAERGEESFRDLEAAVIAELMQGAPCVVATGGGAVLREANRTLLAGGNVVVWLEAPPAVLAARLHGHAATPDERPLLRGGDVVERLAAMAAARAPLYAACAHARVDTAGQGAQEVAGAVLDAVRRGTRDEG